MSSNIPNKDDEIGIVNQSILDGETELVGDTARRQRNYRPTNSTPQRCPLFALCRNPALNLDEVDELGPVLSTQLALVHSDLLLFRKALFPQHHTIQSIDGMPRCAQYLISEYAKLKSDEAFASTFRPDIINCDCKFVLEVDKKLEDIPFASYLYAGLSSGGKRKRKQVIIIDLPSVSNQPAFLHVIVIPTSTAGTKTYQGAEWNAYKYDIWLCPDLNKKYTIFRLHKRPEDTSILKEDTDITEEMPKEVLPSVETGGTTKIPGRSSKRSLTQMNYNVVDMAYEVFGPIAGSKRRRKTQTNTRDTNNTQRRASTASNTSADVSLSHWVSARNSQTTPNTSNSDPSFKDSVEPEDNPHNPMDVDQRIPDEVSRNITNNEIGTNTSTPALDTSTLSDSTLTGLEGLETEPSENTNDTSKAAGLMSTRTQTVNAPIVKTSDTGTLTYDRTVVRFIDTVKGIDEAIPLSKCNTHDDVHDCAVLYKIATRETRLLRVEFEGTDEYEILASDMPEYFEARFT